MPNSDPDGLDPAMQRTAVRTRYARIATGPNDGETPCCGDAGCCEPGASTRTSSRDRALQLGYSSDDVSSIAGEANLGLGCGNPTALTSLEPGETVLDLGSGAGFDCFIAAREVGSGGRVIGVDMTPEMIEKARENATNGDRQNVEFRLGEIEHLPIADAEVDVVISNCVVNLSPDKPRVFNEAFRVLRPGGRLAISDVVLTAPVPDDVRDDPESVAACVAGAVPTDQLESMITAAGFQDVAITPNDESRAVIEEWDADRDVSEFLVSAAITGRKPT